MLIKSDPNNPNSFTVFDKDGKAIKTITCPPIAYGCDIINITDERLYKYTYNSKSLIIITSPEKREIYHLGKLIYTITRK